MENYIEIYSANILRKKFMYIDNVDYLADQLFINKEVRVKFHGTFFKEGVQYVCVLASCAHKNWDKVKEALEALTNKMIICGYTDYEEYCNDLIGRIKEEKLNNESSKIDGYKS